jgi:glycosyltransferase involved in cell wall biosynthesis
MSSVSVIITTYNDSIYLENSLKSVLNQTYIPDEIIVVDDGSFNFESYLIINRFKKNYKFIKYIYQKNFGISSARNVGLKKANSKFICFLDADDTMLYNNLEIKRNKLMTLDDSYFGVFGTFINSNDNKEVLFTNFNDVAFPLNIGKVGYVPGSSASYMFKRHQLMKVNGFDFNLKLYEDFDLIIRLSKIGLKSYGNLGAGFIRNIRTNSVSRSNKYFNTMIEIDKFLNKALIYSYYDIDYINIRKKINLYKFLFNETRKNNILIIDSKNFRYLKLIAVTNKIMIKQLKYRILFYILDILLYIFKFIKIIKYN